MLEVLSYHFLIHRNVQCLIDLQDFGKILPSSGRHKPFSVHRRLNLIEIIRLDVQIGNDGSVNLLLIGKFFPYLIIRLNLDLLHPVQCHNIELPDGFVILRRVARCHDDPALRHLLITEGLTLQKLKHGGRQRLGHAVDLIDEKNPLLLSGLLHFLIDCGNNLAHGIFRYGMLLSLIFFFLNKRQSDSTLAGVMGDGIGK